METDKYTLIVRNLQEVVGDDELQELLKKPNSSVSVYWGTATTGRPHIAYFVPIIKLADMLQAGAKVTVLFADLHAYLDNMKAPWSLLCLRTKYYEAVIKGMFRSICVPLDRLHFIRGADYQLTEAYSIDVYRLMTLTSIHDARKAGAEVVKQVNNPLVSGLLYPLLQALDEVHLNVDIQFGGVDQRKIFMLAEKYLPHLGHKKRIHLMNPMVPGLTGGKMSSSEIDSKIDLLDPPELVTNKLASSICPPNMTAEQGNGLLAFLKYVIFPLVPLRTGLSIPQTPRPYFNFDQVEKDYLLNKITSNALKSVVTDCLNGLLSTIQNDFQDVTLQQLVTNAYPSIIANGDSSMNVSGAEEVPTVFTTEKSILREIDNRVNSIPKITDRSTLLDTFEKEFVGCKPLLEKRVNQTTANGCLRCLWSITPIGLPHLGHSIPIRSFARLSHLNGVYIIILVNNISAHLRSGGGAAAVPWDVIKQRGEFCSTIITGLFTALGGNLNQFSCIMGSDFQLNSEYMLNFYRLISLVPETDCLLSSRLIESTTINQSMFNSHVDTDTVHHNNDNTNNNDNNHSSVQSSSLSELLLPCFDFIDAIQLMADIRLASLSQIKKRQLFQSKFLHHFPNSIETIHLTHPMLISLQAPTNNPVDQLLSFPPMKSCPLSSRCTGPTSAKTLAALMEDHYLPLIEPPSTISGGSIENVPLAGLKRRIKRAFCQPNNIDVNPILDICRWVLIPDLSPGESLIIPRSEKNGGPLHIPATSQSSGNSSGLTQYDVLTEHFANGNLHPGDLKPAVENFLSANHVNSLANRLKQSLPHWNELMLLLDKAFPLPKTHGKQNQKKSNTKQHQQQQANAAKSSLKNQSSLNNTASQPDSLNHWNSLSSEKGTQQLQQQQPEVVPTLNGTTMLPSSTLCVNSSDELNPNRLDIRIGLILSVKIHPNADSLFIEEVDFGSTIGKRTVISALAGVYPMEKLLNCYGVFVINLKPVKIRGIESQAMLLCVSYTEKSSSLLKVQPLHLWNKQDAVLGERFVFHSIDNDDDDDKSFNSPMTISSSSTSPSSSLFFREPDKLLSSKTKLWEYLCPDLAIAPVGQFIHWRNWRLGSINRNKWITVSDDVPPGSTVR
ncbi:unnamed protein product [Schistosoma turkestanicum]|nr:unnamed protein product [Schistosoma turkestanicum]